MAHTACKDEDKKQLDPLASFDALRDEVMTLFISLPWIDIPYPEHQNTRTPEHHEHVLSFLSWLLNSLCRVQDLLGPGLTCPRHQSRGFRPPGHTNGEPSKLS